MVVARFSTHYIVKWLIAFFKERISMVYILDKDGKPLMPSTRHGKIRRLLKSKKAKVVSTVPFTVKLLYTPKTNVIQPLVLGIDPGSGILATAVRVENTPKILYLSEVK